MFTKILPIPKKITFMAFTITAQLKTLRFVVRLTLTTSLTWLLATNPFMPFKFRRIGPSLGVIITIS